MGEINDQVPAPGRPERKHRRFLASYPVQMKFHLENSASELQTVTKNVSVGGFLLVMASSVPQHCLVDFTMTLQGGPLVHPMRVAGEGEVVRIEPLQLDAGFEVAIKCKRPIDLNLSQFTN